MRGAVEAGTVLPAQGVWQAEWVSASLQRQMLSRFSRTANREGKRLSLPCHRIAERQYPESNRLHPADGPAGAFRGIMGRPSPCVLGRRGPRFRVLRRDGPQRAATKTGWPPVFREYKTEAGVPATPVPDRQLRVCFCGQSESRRFFSPAITVCGVCGY